ncbi:MAG TPA: sigma-70 family RNA polymerase sigma factor [Polyangiaceae bacterium]|nr:sigma-70 family RNA polymerase sigma factor [Polyangiaceae bacterium]
MSRSDPARDSVEEFEQALLSHGPSLLAVACRLTRSRSDAEDLVQDALVKALRARDQYQSGTNLKAWLLKILKNTFINRYRRSGLERTVLDGPDADPLADGWIGAETLRAMRDPESQALRPALEREIGAALDAMPEEFRTVVVLSDVEELSYKEIADVVGCPIGTVMSRLHRGRRLLKSRLVEQARALGIGPETTEPKSAPAAEQPVALDAYRAKRSGR